jgi:colanic acid biosynthesis glycosyl transferase WcaI
MLASGRPILACANEGSVIAAAVRDCGAVVPPGDVVAMARELRRLSTDEAVRKIWGQAARSKAVRELAMNEIHRSFEELLGAGRPFRPRASPAHVGADQAQAATAIDIEQEQQSQV